MKYINQTLLNSDAKHQNVSFKRARSHVLKIEAMLAIICLFSVNLASQETEKLSSLFAQQRSAVFLINQSIFIDAAKVKNKALFEKLEFGMNKKILNQYIPIANGTAFLITPDGYLVTAAHVLKYVNADTKFYAARWSFLSFLSKNLIPGYLTEKELYTVCKEFYSLAKNEPILISVKEDNSAEYVAQIIAQDTNLDLALLKIELKEAIKPIIIEANVSFKEGDTVYSIGYPLQFSMDKFLDDFKPTLTNGIISAVRNDNWDIQHTASINPGNSGGPLFRQDGKLIGVSVGTVTDANDLYFSITSKKILNWLGTIDKAGILDFKKN